MDLSRIKKTHIIGLEGAGTSALARILKFKGIDVSGSDEGDHFYNNVLESEGITVRQKFDKDNIPSDADMVIYGSSFRPESNEELKAAFESGMAVFTYAEMLAGLFNESYGIAVCGTHGKSTTSAMLSFVLIRIGLDPSAIVGAKIPQLGGNSISGKSEYFVIEADEYQNKLALYKPKAAILTSVDYDHPDFFKTFGDYKKAFSDFVAKIPKIGFLAVWGDSVATNEIACSCQGNIIKYGFMEDNDIIIKNHSFIGAQQRFEIIFLDESLGFFEIKLPGKHNVLNAAAVIAACHQLNADLEKTREALRDFEGTSRRFEMIGGRNGAILIDDYAHHPEEIKATLRAAREIYPEKNIIAVFHPHSFSRTAALLEDFAQSFDDADKAIILDIYGSARESSGTVSSADLVKSVNKYSRDKADYVPTIAEAVEFLQDKIGGNDVIITIGAGNVFEVARKLKQ
ncbi:MAG: UDP-N-acetylmuramate--L-alanine ligase [bacterium]|nr:UDP-N-acetylmuramate--L-alanine ligase [bacterium]